MDELIAEIRAWQAATFPTATADSCFAHLCEEMEELRESRGFDEGVDVFFLLLGWMDRDGTTLEAEARQKFEWVKQQRFAMTEKGYAKRINPEVQYGVHTQHELEVAQDHE